MDCKLCRAKTNASIASMYSKLMADAREDRFTSATYSVPTGGPLLASQQQRMTPAANTNVNSSQRLNRPIMSCSCLVIMTRDLVT